MLTRIGAPVVDGEVTVPHAFDQFDKKGRLSDPAIEEALSGLLDGLTGAVAANEPHAGSLR